MSVNVFLPLFLKPGDELEEGADITADELRELATDLDDRLQSTASILHKLRRDGWTAQTSLYAVSCAHEDVCTVDEAEARLRQLGIDPGDLTIDECDDEEDCVPEYILQEDEP